MIRNKKRGWRGGPRWETRDEGIGLRTWTIWRGSEDMGQGLQTKTRELGQRTVDRGQEVRRGDGR